MPRSRSPRRHVTLRISGAEKGESHIGMLANPRLRTAAVRTEVLDVDVLAFNPRRSPRSANPGRSPPVPSSLQRPHTSVRKSEDSRIFVSAASLTASERSSLTMQGVFGCSDLWVEGASVVSDGSRLTRSHLWRLPAEHGFVARSWRPGMPSSSLHRSSRLRVSARQKGVGSREFSTRSTSRASAP